MCSIKSAKYIPIGHCHFIKTTSWHYENFLDAVLQNFYKIPTDLDNIRISIIDYWILHVTRHDEATIIPYSPISSSMGFAFFCYLFIERSWKDHGYRWVRNCFSTFRIILKIIFWCSMSTPALSLTSAPVSSMAAQVQLRGRLKIEIFLRPAHGTWLQYTVQDERRNVAVLTTVQLFWGKCWDLYLHALFACTLIMCSSEFLV